MIQLGYLEALQVYLMKNDLLGDFCGLCTMCNKGNIHLRKDGTSITKGELQYFCKCSNYLCKEKLYSYTAHFLNERTLIFVQHYLNILLGTQKGATYCCTHSKNFIKNID